MKDTIFSGVSSPDPNSREEEKWTRGPRREDRIWTDMTKKVHLSVQIWK
jgi:hypothetical protein